MSELYARDAGAVSQCITDRVQLNRNQFPGCFQSFLSNATQTFQCSMRVRPSCMLIICLFEEYA